MIILPAQMPSVMALSSVSPTLLQLPMLLTLVRQPLRKQGTIFDVLSTAAFVPVTQSPGQMSLEKLTNGQEMVEFKYRSTHSNSP